MRRYDLRLPKQRDNSVAAVPSSNYAPPKEKARRAMRRAGFPDLFDRLGL